MDLVYQEILNSSDHRVRLKTLLKINDVIDYLIANFLIDSEDYSKIWNDEETNRLDILFDIIKTKTVAIIDSCFVYFKQLNADINDFLSDIKKTTVSLAQRRGGFPKLNHYINRTQEESRLKDHFQNLTWDKKLVVHGKVGDGKSYFVCHCLSDYDLVTRYFGNNLYWINVGEHQTAENVLQPLKRLYNRVIFQTSHSIGSYSPMNLEELTDVLASLFANERMKNSLVILDNARCEDVIKAFENINCKLVVTTHLKPTDNAQPFEVNSGFILEETNDLFARYLGVNKSSLHFLQEEIKEIQDLCKGHPSTLSLLGSFLKSREAEALHNSKPWNHIIKVFKTGEMQMLGTQDIKRKTENFNQALKMCIDTIEDDLKHFYYDFAIFPRDANISSEVLQVLWTKTAGQVRDIMFHFENRSLISSFYNEKQNSYIYVCHDLFLNYLKEVTKHSRQKMHSTLIDRYESLYEYQELPNDNYILQYLGFHLHQANKLGSFKKFLDLRFIEHKIKVLGVTNMEQDLLMYKDYIVDNNQDLSDKFNNYLEFIKKKQSDFHNLPKTDICQMALPFLEQDARTIIQTNEARAINKLYFTTSCSAGRVENSQQFSIAGENLSSIAFCSDFYTTKILVGTMKGDILLYCPQIYSTSERFEGHTDEVHDLKVSSDDSSFLSVSKDKSVKLWRLIKPRLSVDDNSNEAPNSPKCVQNPYVNPFGSGRQDNYKNFISPKADDHLTSAAFNNNYSTNKYIVTGTFKGKIMVWTSATTGIVAGTTNTGYPVESVMFSSDDSTIISTREEDIQIHSFRNQRLTYMSTINTPQHIHRLLCPKIDSLIAISDKRVSMCMSRGENYDFSNASVVDVFNGHHSEIKCAAMTKDGSYFAISMDDIVYLFTSREGKLVKTLKYTDRIISMSLKKGDDVEDTVSIILILGNNMIQKRDIRMRDDDQPMQRHTLVTTFWKKRIRPLVALILNNTCLQVQLEFSPITEIKELRKITCVTFSVCGNNVIYALEDGQIKEFHYKTRHSRTLMELKESIVYLESFMYHPNGETVTDSAELIFSSFEIENGAIVAVTGSNKVCVLIKEEVTSFPCEYKVVKVFNLRSKANMLYVDENGTVYRRKSDGTIDVVGSSEFWNVYKVEMVAICERSNLLAMVFIKDTNINHSVIRILNYSTTKSSSIYNFELKPTSCCFSFTGSLLAIAEGTRVKIYRTNNISDNPVVLAHTSPITFLQFSRTSEPILVAVGDEISWWNLQTFANKGSSIPINSQRADIVVKGNVNSQFWLSRTIHETIPFLLQSIELYSKAVYFSVSKDFRTFLTVDDEGRIYLMKYLETDDGAIKIDTRRQ